MRLEGLGEGSRLYLCYWMGLGKFTLFLLLRYIHYKPDNDSRVMKNRLYVFAFDFSINKPACTVYRNIFGEEDIMFYIWPMELTKKEKAIYEGIDNASGGTFTCKYRDLDAISKDSKYSTSELALEHTKRSLHLANMIARDLDKLIGVIGEKDRVIIASETLSFGSKGNSTLDLATYKGVLLGKLYETFHNVEMYAYAPGTIKSIAGCATKDKRGDKHAMIKAFLEEKLPSESFFATKLASHDLEYVKTKGKSAGDIEYFHCVDDIADSYFTLKTVSEKEGLGIDFSKCLSSR